MVINLVLLLPLLIWLIVIFIQRALMEESEEIGLEENFKKLVTVGIPCILLVSFAAICFNRQF